MSCSTVAPHHAQHNAVRCTFRSADRMSAAALAVASTRASYMTPAARLPAPPPGATSPSRSAATLKRCSVQAAVLL